MRVARLFALMRQALVYSASSLSCSFDALALAFAVVGKSVGSGMPHTLPEKCEAESEGSDPRSGGGGGGRSIGNEANSLAASRVAAMSETHVIVFPKPI